jgi:hypothetical protein
MKSIVRPTRPDIGKTEPGIQAVPITENRMSRLKERMKNDPSLRVGSAVKPFPKLVGCELEAAMNRREKAVREGMRLFKIDFFMIDPLEKAAPFKIDNAKDIHDFIEMGSPHIEWVASDVVIPKEAGD